MVEENRYIEHMEFPDGFKILSSSGFVPLKSIQKTEPTESIKLKLENGIELICSRNHQLLDSNNEWIFAQDTLNKEVLTKDGVSKVVSISDAGKRELYDFTVDSEQHEYLANGIASHNCVCIDEAAYVSHLDNIMNAINPTLSRDDNAELILTTTPAGKNGDFYELYSDAINDDNWYVQYTTIHDAINDGLNANIQSLKTLCPDKDVFAQEYECQFLSEYGSLIDVSLIDYYDDLPTGNRTNYLGMDIGSRSDRSAIVILRKIGEVVYLDDIVVLNKMEYNQQLQMVKEIHNINKFNAGYIDETGIGSAFAEFVKKNVSSKINGFTFTGSNKTPMYEKLRSLIYEHKLKVNIKFKSIIEKDFNNVQRVVNEAGQVKYIAGHDENGHSDITSGLVLGIRAIDDNPANFQMPIQYIRQSIF